MVEQEEIVFEIGGEGGGITIFRLRSKSGEKFIYHHSEFDPTDEGPGVNFKNEYTSFEEPFQIIIKKYTWYLLHLQTAHEDFKDYISKELINALNNDSVSPEMLTWTQIDLEESLKIRLICETKNQGKDINWSLSLDPYIERQQF